MVDYGAIFSALHSYGFELVTWGTWHRPWSWDLIGDWRNLITDKNSTGHRWDSNPGPCR